MGHNKRNFFPSDLKNSATKHRKPPKGLLRAPSELRPIALFIKTKNIEKKIEIFEEQSQNKSKNHPEVSSNLGEMALEIAMSKELEHEERQDYLDKSYYLLKDTIESDTSTGKSMSTSARKYLSNIDLFNSMINGEMPQREDLDRSYGLTLSNVSELITGRALILNKESEQHNFIELTGALSELCVIGLLKRFESQCLGDASWLALPSQFSENHSLPHKKVKNSWDITGFVALDETSSYDPLYRLQVKSSLHDDNAYSDTIPVIVPGADLAPETTGASSTLNYKTRQMLHAMMREYDGDASSGQISLLDTATDKLLDKIN